MQHSAEPDILSQLDTIFAQLNPQEVEQFYSAYKQWLLQQQIASLERRILHVQQQLAENARRIQETHPSPIALATLARLQSNGVNDIDLLDCMLARGEAWLDETMQRLDYCEQIDDFISDNYTQWCRLALDGAFDWIDSMRDEASLTSTAIEEAPPITADTVVNATTEATEALLLQKLTSESDEQEDDSWQEVTLKQAAIKLQAQIEDTSISQGESPVFVEFASKEEPTMDTASNVSEQSTLVEIPVAEETANVEETSSPEPARSEYIEVEEPARLEESTPGILEHQPAVEPEIEGNSEIPVNQVDAINHAVPTAWHAVQDEVRRGSGQSEYGPSVPTKLPKRSLLQRVIAKLLGE